MPNGSHEHIISLATRLKRAYFMNIAYSAPIGRKNKSGRPKLTHFLQRDKDQDDAYVYGADTTTVRSSKRSKKLNNFFIISQNLYRIIILEKLCQQKCIYYVVSHTIIYNSSLSIILQGFLSIHVNINQFGNKSKYFVHTR